jgi:hypothetical protein
MESSMECPPKTKNRSTIQYMIPLLEYVQRSWGNTIVTLATHIYYNTSYGNSLNALQLMNRLRKCGVYV